MKLFIPYNDIDARDPLFEPECRNCKYVGMVMQKDGNSDVYVCNDTLIIKHSDECGDYMSGRLSDYMHILLQESSCTSDLRWIIFQLYDKGILKFRPKFLFNLPQKKFVVRYNFDRMRIGDTDEFYTDHKKIRNAATKYNFTHKTGPKKLQVRVVGDELTLTMIANN